MQPTKEAIKYFSKWFARSIGGTDLLERGDSGQHVQNIITALVELGYRIPITDTFSQDIEQQLIEFQKKHHARNEDGKFGPGTKTLLTEKALEGLGPDFFGKLKPTFPRFHRVFISYAWKDGTKVDKLDQWLTDNSLLVTRDTRDFPAGQQLPDAIQRSLHLSDRACIVYSAASRSRNWPTFERYAAEEVEKLRRIPFLVYVLLDGCEPPKHDPNRIYIDASKKSLREVGNDLIRAVTGQTGAPPKVEYNEDQPL